MPDATPTKSLHLDLDKFLKSWNTRLQEETTLTKLLLETPLGYLWREFDGIQHLVAYCNIISIRNYFKLANWYLVAKVTTGWQKTLCFSKIERDKVQRQESSTKTRTMHSYPVCREIPNSRSEILDQKRGGWRWMVDMQDGTNCPNISNYSSTKCNISEKTRAQGKS